MKKREQFIDLMGEVDPLHLEAHIEKNTNTKKAQIRRYIASAGIYAAACLVVCLIIPFIINETGIGLNPGTNPPVSQTTDDTQGETEAPDTVEPPVTEMPNFSIEDIIEEKGYTLYKMTAEELTGFDNRIESENIYGKIAVEVTDMTATYVCMEVRILEADKVDGSSVVSREITIDQVIVGNGGAGCNWKLNGMYEFELFEAEGMTVFGRNQADTELYGGFVSEYHIVAGTDYGYIAPASGKNNMSYSLYVEDGKLMYGLYNNVYMTDNVYEILFSITSRESWLEERGTVSLKYNEVIFTPTSNMYMDEEYIANLERIFEEVKVQQVIEMSDGTVYDFTPFNTLDELMAYNRVKVIRTKLDSYLRELYNLTARENNVDIPVYLDAEFLVENMGKNEVALRGLYEDYLGKTHRIILASLNKLIPEERRFQRRPDWDDGTEQYDGIDGNLYYILDDTVVIDEGDREEFAQYLECRYGQVDVERFESIRGKYENVGTVAVYEMGEWYWYNTADDSITKIERFPNYYTVDGMYRKMEGWFGNVDAQLQGMAVHETLYSDKVGFSTFFDKICGEEYTRFMNGEDYHDLVALKFTDCPDVVLIAEINTKAESTEHISSKRYLNSVIWKGERFYTPEFGHAPHIEVEITEDFVCIIAAASGIGKMTYVHDGGVEYHTPRDIMENCALAYICEDEGILGYKYFGDEYRDMLHSNGPLYYLSTEDDFDDLFYGIGTVQLIDGKIKYVDDITYTLGEWFNSPDGPRDATGCETLEAYSEWIRYQDMVSWRDQLIKMKAEEVLHYRLLNMTVEEIEAEFGELEFSHLVSGGTPVYKTPVESFYLEFTKYSDDPEAELPRDIYPAIVETRGSYIGMDSSEVRKHFGDIVLTFGQSDSLTGFGSNFEYAGYNVFIKWDIPEELYNKTAKAIIWGDDAEEKAATDELTSMMMSGEAGATVGSVRVSKQ